MRLNALELESLKAHHDLIEGLFGDGWDLGIRCWIADRNDHIGVLVRRT